MTSALSGAPVALTQARKSPRSNEPLLLPLALRAWICAGVSGAVGPSSCATTSAVVTKLALTVYGRLIGSVMTGFPEVVSPDHPTNVAPAAGVAVSCTGLASVMNVPAGLPMGFDATVPPA